MAKRSSKKRKTRSEKKTELGLFGTKIDPKLIFEHEYKDFLGMSDEELELRFEGIISDFKEEFSKSDPLSILGCLAVYGMSAGIGNDGEIERYGPERTQSDIEFLQAILLSMPRGTISNEQISPKIVQKFFDELPNLSKAFHMRRINRLKEAPEKKTLLTMIQEELRNHTQHVRNWGFINDVIEITSEVSKKFDEEFKEKYKFSYTKAICVFKAVVDDFELLINKRTEAISLLFKAKTIKSAIETFFNEISLSEELDNFYSYVKEKRMTIKDVQILLWGYYDSYIGYSFILNSVKISQKVEISVSELENIFDTFSLALGSLEGHNPKVFFLDNPVWNKPLIKLDDNNYFCAAPTSFFSFALKILSGLCKEDNMLNKKLSQARASFLEERIESTFKQAFPETQSIRNYKWTEGDNSYENDFLIKVDSALFIVEAKSHEITWPALRGAEDRIKRHVQEVLYEPSIQSKRLEDKILQHQAENLPIGEFPFEIDKIKSINRISITLDDFATLQTMVHQFKSIGWIPDNHQIAPCILFSDLGVIFDILDRKFHKINYLKRRTTLPNTVSYKADEIDLLGLYLVCGFNTHSAQLDGTHLILTGMSKPIDDYYIALDSKVASPKKPMPKLTRFWNSICETLETRSTQRWSEAASILLSLSFDEQKEFEKYYKKIIQNVKNDHRNMGNVDAVIFHSTYHKESAIALYAFKEKDISARREKMENLARQVFEDAGIKRCLVIGQNIEDDRPEYVYSTLAVYFQ